MKALGYANSIVSRANINQVAYNSKSFQALWDREKLPQAAMSGHNTSGGQMITASFKNFGTQTNNRAQKCFIFAHHDAVLELASTSATVMV